MTLKALMVSLGQIAINDQACGWAGCGSSVYELNNLTIRDYPAFWCSPTGAHRVEQNYTTYTMSLFLIDRLLEGNDNDVDIQSAAVETMKNIIKKAAYLDGVVGISDEYVINIFVETERFKDRCSGIYATVEFSIVNDSVCVTYTDDSPQPEPEPEPEPGPTPPAPDTGETNYFLYFVNVDGEWYPAETTSVTVEWRTNYPSLDYIFYGSEGVIESGNTEGAIRLDLTFPENESTDITQEYTFMFLKENGANLSGISWYQDVKAVEPEPEPPTPDTGDTGTTEYFFDFDIPDNATIPADQTGYTISWRTNYPEITYVFVSMEDTDSDTLDSGTTQVSFTFPANTSATLTAQYVFNVYDADSNKIGSRTWTQERAEGYFEFITQSGARLSSAATSYHVDWDTNYDSLRYTLETPSGTLSSGAVYESGYTFTFPASMVNYPTTYILTMRNPLNSRVLGTLMWIQAENGEMPRDYSGDYLTFDILSGGTIESKSGVWQYSKDSGNTWLDSDNGVVNVSTGDKVLAKAKAPMRFASSSTAVFNISGNILSIVNGDDFQKEWGGGLMQFSNMFKGMKVVSAENLVMPNASASFMCNAMFAECTMLTTAPRVLPATKLSEYAYERMFKGCTSLVNPPALPATTLDRCCYKQMFYKCTSLVTAPALPATTLAESCYLYMFMECSSLLNAPVLPATQLVKGCYNGMFARCYSLTTAPELPATTLADDCYRWMFMHCNSLNYIKCLATDKSATGCTYGWVALGVPNQGTFVKHPDAQWEYGNDGIPNGWTVQEI